MSRLRKQLFPLLGACGAILCLAAALAVAANLVRPPAERLPWTADWSRHLESRAAAAGLKTATMPTLSRLVAAPGPAVLLDARSPAAHAAGHIPGALSLPPGDFPECFPLLAEEGDWTPATPFWVYCEGYACDDALHLGQTLLSADFPDVTLYAGGWDEWSRHGGAVETEDAP